MSLADAKKVLSDFSIEYTGNGTIVKTMSPAAETSVMVGSKIRLMLGN